MTNLLLKHKHGFTLIEMISVLVIIGIISAIGSRYLVVGVDSYNDAQDRSKLIQKGRLVIEQMNRQLRVAVPNSVRVSTSGNCVEFFPIVGAANYLGDLPDSDNGATAVTSIATAPFNLGLGSASHAIVGAFVPSEIYTVATPSARITVSAMGAGPHTSVPLSSAHTFTRNSINRRVFVADSPKRFCISATNLILYEGYGLDTSAVLTESNPGGSSAVMAQGVAAAGTAFSLSAASQDRNAAVILALNFSERTNNITLNHKILVRNIP